MLTHLLKRYTSSRTHHQHGTDELGRGFGDGRHESELAPFYSEDQSVLARGKEGVHALEHQIEENPQGPDLREKRVVRCAVEDLWCHIGRGATVRIHQVVWVRDHTEAKIYEFYVVPVDENVFSLHIPMSYPFGMQVLESSDNFREVS